MTTGPRTVRAIDGSTTAPLVARAANDHRAALAGRWGRRVTVAVIAAFVTAGLLGWFGYRSSSAERHAAGVHVRLEWPGVSRGGLPTHWSLTVSADDGALDGRITVGTTSDYFRTFDHNDLVPEPDAVWQDAEVTRWEFDAAGERELAITLDVRTQPDARWTHGAVTTVDVDGRTVATFDYRTLVLP